MLRLKECRGVGLDWRQRECETSRDTLVGDENRGRVVKRRSGRGVSVQRRGWAKV
jgi:hypothetical protein